MKSGRSGLGAMVLGLVTACGGAAREAEAPSPVSTQSPDPDVQTGDTRAAEAAPPAAADEAANARGLPTECAPANDLCLPPRAFVKRLCQDAYSGAAIALFAKSSPFSRGYVLSREVKAVNTLGGPASDAPLRFAEEVIILTQTGGGGDGQMQVSGMGGHEVLRWDGTCATLGEGELATRAPAPARYAPFAWRDIDTNIQAALLRNAAVEAARQAHRKHCHGVSLGQISAACAKAEAALGDSIVAAVRTGIELPVPDRMP